MTAGEAWRPLDICVLPRVSQRDQQRPSACWRQGWCERGLSGGAFLGRNGQCRLRTRDSLLDQLPAHTPPGAREEGQVPCRLGSGPGAAGRGGPSPCTRGRSTFPGAPAHFTPGSEPGLCHLEPHLHPRPPPPLQASTLVSRKLKYRTAGERLCPVWGPNHPPWSPCPQGILAGGKGQRGRPERAPASAPFWPPDQGTSLTERSSGTRTGAAIWRERPASHGASGHLHFGPHKLLDGS